MKLKTLAITGVIVIFAALTTTNAEPPKRQAYGPLQFGDTAEEANKTSLEMNSAQERRGTLDTANDVMRQFVTPTSKCPPKLTTQFSKINVLHGFATGPRLYSVSIYTKDQLLADYPTELKLAWEVFRDIAISKFGTPTTIAPFPVATAFTQRLQCIETDSWKFDGIDIHLSIRSIELPNRPRSFTVIFEATDTVMYAANKVPKN